MSTAIAISNGAKRAIATSVKTRFVQTPFYVLRAFCRCGDNAIVVVVVVVVVYAFKFHNKLLHYFGN